MRWNEEQDEVLKMNANKGVQHCRDLIARKFGIIRTLEATQRRASRIGVSLMTYEICPECGRPAKLNQRSKLCRTCNEKMLRDQQAAIKYEIQQTIRLIEGGKDDGYERIHRQYSALRKHNNRQRKKALEAGCGDFVGLSEEMSSACSEP